MSRYKTIRDKKRCENCGHFVEKRFCPECGQENVETRQPFHYLFIHFFEDFVHYDSRFWKTIWYLLSRPAKLTKEFLSGKRTSYVSPVKLYIFISFITFLIPAILPDTNKKKETQQEVSASLETDIKKQVDDVQQANTSPIERLSTKDKFEENVKHHFPQAVFCYMPIFAFWLWLFHSKKKWFYFDHGIFTLHYFSFILLSFLLYILLGKMLNLLPFDTGFIANIITVALFCYYIYYFFHSHRLVYMETKANSRLKCILLFFINTFCTGIFFVLYTAIIALVTEENIYSKIIDAIKD